MCLRCKRDLTLSGFIGPINRQAVSGTREYDTIGTSTWIGPGRYAVHRLRFPCVRPSFVWKDRANAIKRTRIFVVHKERKRNTHIHERIS